MSGRIVGGCDVQVGADVGVVLRILDIEEDGGRFGVVLVYVGDVQGY